MPVARLSFSVYQSSNENGGGGHAWQNVQGAGATAEGAGAYDVRDPNSADMNWLRSNGDGARGSASIPAGSTVTGIIIGFQAHCTGGNQVGGTYEVGIFKAGNPVGTSKTGSIGNNAFIGPFGATNDLWGLGALATPSYFTNMYFGLHLNFPNITSNITMYAWNGYMDIYYNDPVSTATSIETAGGDNQSIQVSTSYTQPLKALVRDQGGNPKSGVGVTFTMPASGASALFSNSTRFSTANTDANGVATSLNFQANATTGNFQPVADITGSSPLIFTQYNLTNLAPPVTKVPTTISRQQGDGQVAAVSTAFNQTLRVRVFDQFALPMPNVDITWPPPVGGPSGLFTGGNPARSFSDINGIATSPVLFANSVAGTWTLNVIPTGFPAVVAPFGLTNLANNAPPAPTSVQVMSGATQSAALNANFSSGIQVKILDQYGSGYPGATVVATTPGVTFGTFVANASTTRTVVTNASGIADFGLIKASGAVQSNWAITLTGNALVAGVDTFAAAGTVGGLNNIDATLVTQIAVTQGAGQIATPSTSFGLALQVRATNGLNAGVQNFAVTFTAPGSGASATFAGAVSQIVNTDVNGYATSAVPVANSTEGTYNVTATGAGVASKTIGLQNGNTYGTEVCTVFENLPGPNSNQPINNVGGSPASWGSLGNASNAAQGATGATNNQQPPSSNVSLAMYLYPAPATWAAVPNDARITSISLNFSVMTATVSAQTGTGTIRMALLKAGLVSPDYPLASFPTTLDLWGNVSRTATMTLAAPISGAELKANCGFILNFQPASNFGPSQTCRVNGAQVKVCWRPLIPPPVQPAMGPLQPCEA